MQLLTIGKNQAGQRLDKFLKKALPNADASQEKYYVEREKG